MPVEATIGALRSTRDVEYALRALANNQAVGPDDLPAGLPHMVIQGVPAILTALHDIFAATWRGKASPEVKRCRHQCPMQDSTQCHTYRNKSLVAHAGRVMPQAVACQLGDYREAKTISSAKQHIFRLQRSTVKTLLTMHLAQELGQKGRVTLFLYLINPHNACDSVGHKLQREVLARFGVQTIQRRSRSSNRSTTACAHARGRMMGAVRTSAWGRACDKGA